MIARPLVFVNCTRRKRKSAAPELRADALGRGTPELVAAQWIHFLALAPAEHEARSLYCGRSITEAALATDAIGGDLYFVSAGLGLVAATEINPTYNLTISPLDPCCILDRLECVDRTTSMWWKALTIARGTHRAVTTRIDSSPGLALLAMPKTYLSMIEEELEALSDESMNRLRIIGPRKASELPAFLRNAWMPYDGRLQAIVGFAGTETDFPQRALRHFAITVLRADPFGSAAAHAARVDRALGTNRNPRRPPGRRMADDELVTIMRELWPSHGGNRTRVLRELRGRLGIACEQKRFRLLADQLEDSLSATC